MSAKQYRELVLLAAKIAANENVSDCEVAYPKYCLRYLPSDVEALPNVEVQSAANEVIAMLQGGFPSYDKSPLPKSLCGVPFPQTTEQFRESVTVWDLTMFDSISRQMQDAPILDLAMALCNVWLTKRIVTQPVIAEFDGLIAAAPARDVFPCGFFLYRSYVLNKRISAN